MVLVFKCGSANFLHKTTMHLRNKNNCILHKQRNIETHKWISGLMKQVVQSSIAISHVISIWKFSVMPMSKIWHASPVGECAMKREMATCVIRSQIETRFRVTTKMMTVNTNRFSTTMVVGMVNIFFSSHSFSLTSSFVTHNFG